MRTVRESEWPLVGRDDEIGQALAALDDNAPSQGVVLVGNSGVGKTTMAGALADAVETRGLSVRFVQGTRTGSAVPLGAFYRFLPVGTAREPAAMLAVAQRTLEREQNLVLVVDDIQFLDPLSVTLVHRLLAQPLLAQGSTRLIATVRAGDAVPDAVTAVFNERPLLHLHITAFTPERTATLTRTVLGEAVETRLIDELHSRSAGNPLMIRGLLDAGRQSGALMHTADGWQLRAELHLDRHLYDMLELRLRSLAPEEQHAVEVLSASEGIAWEVVSELCDTDAVEKLKRGGMIQMVAQQSHTVARLTHPILGEAAVRRAGAARNHQLKSLLAEALRTQART
ncbi:MAG: AAA family ATPase [Mycobacterium sp.]